MSLFDTITAQIIAAIEEGTGSYEMPWNRNPSISLPVNALTARPYRGTNTLLLRAIALKSGYASPEWATYRQWAELGAQVRKGEKASVVLLWKPSSAGGDQDGADGPDATAPRFVSRAFHVFNIAQIDGYSPTERPLLDPAQRIDEAEAFFGCVPATVWQGSDEAFFDPKSDTISMPSFERFLAPEFYYSVLAHELTHWTGAKPRLDRDLAGRFGSEAYAMEELVAELGAAFLAAHLQINREPRRDHAPYIANWLKVLRNDPRAIVTAASKAQAAADYIIALASNEPPVTASIHQDHAGPAA